MKKIIFPDGSGGISIVSPAREFQEKLEELAVEVVPAGVPFRVLEDAAFPQDVRLRGAWVFNFDDPAAAIMIDPEKAVKIQRVPVPTRVYKADVWRRASDQEAAVMDGMLVALPVKQRRLWEDARYLETTDDYWPLIVGGLTQAFGAARAAELLAPSDAQ